jgi:hypothetical protein
MDGGSVVLAGALNDPSILNIKKASFRGLSLLVIQYKKLLKN